MYLFLFLCLSVVGLKVTSSDNEYYVDYEDHCSPDNASTCHEGRCCVRQTIIIQEDVHGDPKPAFRVSCKPLKQEGSFCLIERTSEMCPCASHLQCLPARFGIKYGHCTLMEIPRTRLDLIIE